MRVLIGCEQFGHVRQAFRRRGFDAWSCDLQPARDGSPYHLQCDVLTVLNRGWGLGIFHPDCTYLTNSAAWAFRGGPYHQKVKADTLVGAARREARQKAVEFVFRLRDAPIRFKAIENPRGHLSTAWRGPDQSIQPNQFGDDASKETCLWLEGGLPLLKPTKQIEPRWVNGKPRWANQTDSGQNRLSPGEDRGGLFPGWRAVPVVIGSGLLVLPYQRQNPIAWLLSAPPLVFVGRLSYSLYLWHWPVLVLFKHYAGMPPSPSAKIVLLGFISLLSLLTFIFIETPARRSQFRISSYFLLGATAAAFLCIASTAVIRADGFPWRTDDPANPQFTLEAMWNYQCPQQVSIPELSSNSLCGVGAPWQQAERRAILFGDSHAFHLLPLLDQVAQDAHASVVLMEGQCLPFISANGIKRYFPEQPTFNSYCEGQRRKVLDFAKKPEVTNIILAGSWAFYLNDLYTTDENVRSPDQSLGLLREGLTQFFDEAKRPGLAFSIFGEVPRAGIIAPIECINPNAEILRPACDKSRVLVQASYIRKALGPSNDVITSVATHENAVAISSIDQMCNEDTCIKFVNGEWLYRDGGHIRRNLKPQTRYGLANILGLKRIFSDHGLTDQTAAAIPRQN